MTRKQAIAEMQCPASMCPLLAREGSPWTGEKGAICPGHDELKSGGCPWWGMGCGWGGMVAAVDDAERDGGAAHIIGPNNPRRQGFAPPKSYDCPLASVCRWQEQSQTGLCAPREAMKRGMDPRVCLF